MRTLATPLVLLFASACGPTLEPTLSAIHEEVFAISCSQSSCHGGASPENGLDLTTPAAAHASLVGVQGEDADLVRVVPGDPEASLLYRTLQEETEGVSLMPEGALEPLEDYKIEGIRRWIEDGAPAE